MLRQYPRQAMITVLDGRRAQAQTPPIAQPALFGSPAFLL